MRKYLLSVLLSVILIAALMLVFASCTDYSDTPDKTDTNSSEQNVETEPSDNVDENALSLNADLLDEYKMTYAELTEKHGKVTGYERFDGGNFYLFEKGYGYYFFYIDYDQNKLVTDQNSGLEYMPINDDELCRGIRDIPSKVLFNGTFETISIETIANMNGINLVCTNNDGIVTPRAYASTFTYDGWNSDKVNLVIYHEDKEMIDSTSEARIFIHPQDIRVEEEQ